MNFRTTIATALLCFLFTLPVPVTAQIFDEDYTRSDTNPTVDGSLGIYSDRMYRGQNLYNGTSIQPQLRVSANTDIGIFFFRYFGHFSADQGDARRSSVAPFDTTNDEEEIKAVETTESFDEYNFDLGYALEAEDLRLDFGHIFYNYDRTTERLRDTREFYGKLSTKIIGNPSLLMAYDYDEREGLYYEGSVSQAFAVPGLNQGITLTPGLTIGLNHSLDNGNHPLYDDSGLVFFNVGVTGKLPLNSSLSLRPEVNYNEGVDDFATSDFWFGVALDGSI